MNKSNVPKNCSWKLLQKRCQWKPHNVPSKHTFPEVGPTLLSFGSLFPDRCLPLLKDNKYKWYLMDLIAYVDHGKHNHSLTWSNWKFFVDGNILHQHLLQSLQSNNITEGLCFDPRIFWKFWLHDDLILKILSGRLWMLHVEIWSRVTH